MKARKKKERRAHRRISGPTITDTGGLQGGGELEWRACPRLSELM